MTLRKRVRATAAAGLALALIGTMGSAASAGDLADRMGISQPSSAWQVRLRALGVITDDKGSVDQIPGSGLSYSDSVTPELDISYFFTDNIAAELILGTTKANINGTGTIAGLGQVGEVWVLPPTVTLQYHFTDFGAFKPYVGAGVNYTIFYEQDGVGALTSIDVEDTFGAALQVGFDYMIDENWGFNVDVKKLFLEPKWSGVTGGTTITGKAKLNPWLIGTGLTYRF
ncbi:OmpW family protein [uncultured Hoeflea sp.]|uniref:OmpW/AlkL family protein n=1 Tax=uncultured Hoeflea sp. TaxID=538666 RepID=UPI0026023F08|nr:OmpW family protein [uncultured Hoeflea sp.]